jgi:hypothetical protein
MNVSVSEAGGLGLVSKAKLLSTCKSKKSWGVMMRVLKLDSRIVPGKLSTFLD